MRRITNKEIGAALYKRIALLLPVVTPLPKVGDHASATSKPSMESSSFYAQAFLGKSCPRSWALAWNDLLAATS